MPTRDGRTNVNYFCRSITYDRAGIPFGGLFNLTVSWERRGDGTNYNNGNDDEGNDHDLYLPRVGHRVSQFESVLFSSNE